MAPEAARDRAWLRELLQGSRQLGDDGLRAFADESRRHHVGDDVHLRALVEVSSHCVRRCAYCGLRAPNAALARYRLERAEVLARARLAARLGLGTIVLQAGEDPGLDETWVAEVVRAIKAETPLAVTLSLGERTVAELAAWRRAGADRYLLRFETSNGELYARIHPPHDPAAPDRLALLAILRDLGYEVGSGMLVGIPGQTWDDLAGDLELIRELDLDMVGLGPYIAHPTTPLGRSAAPSGPGQVPADVATTLRALALARLACPWANIPATTAVATLDQAEGYERGLAAGANVIMPDLTPPDRAAGYQIYPGRRARTETEAELVEGLRRRIRALGRAVGAGRGDSARPGRLARAQALERMREGRP
jgi:biotin synthase